MKTHQAHQLQAQSVYDHPTTTNGKGRLHLSVETASDLRKSGRDDRI
jgi:hypothetical protein